MLKILKSEHNGICSICSANEFVLRAAFRRARPLNEKVLIESTSNQVDQYGGYTGMTPKHFVAYVNGIAESENFSADNIILGGDHLGPNAWQNETADLAMGKAKGLIDAYVQAGYKKIHLDTSMRCAGDPGGKDTLLDVQIVAERAAALCQIAEENVTTGELPQYIIGTDVPIPGGAKEQLDNIRITPVNEVHETIEVTQKAFYNLGLQDAWERVIAVVVQPGVEFGDTVVVNYQREKARDLNQFIKGAGNLVYEAHSTDYQTKHALRDLVEDHFAILKVGPWLTFALRETIFALAMIEKELLSENKGIRLSALIETIETQMLQNPKYWQAHYHGNQTEQKLARKYSYSDRVRYYWPDPAIAASLDLMLQNLNGITIPMNLLCQFLPMQYEAILENKIENKLHDLLYLGVARVLDKYGYATGELN